MEDTFIVQVHEPPEKLTKTIPAGHSIDHQAFVACCAVSYIA